MQPFASTALFNAPFHNMTAASASSLAGPSRPGPLKSGDIL